MAGLVVDTALIAVSFGRPELSSTERWASLGDFLEHRGGTTLRFRHDLYRAVAYEGLAYRRRREAHLALGHTLELQYADDLAQVAPLLSTHFDRGRDGSRAWTYSVLAGDTSRAGYANDEAITLYRRALEHAGSAAAGSEQVARVAEALADVHQLSASYPDAVDAYQRSRRADRSNIEREARVLRKIGYVREREGRLSQALRWYSRARDALAELPDGPERRHEEAGSRFPAPAPSTDKAAIARAPPTPSRPLRPPRQRMTGLASPAHTTSWRLLTASSAGLRQRSSPRRH